MTSHAADEKQAAPPMRRRGDRHRQAILRAARELLEETPFAELSVRAISLRAGVARSGFYFYFDSKYSVLAQILPRPPKNSKKPASISPPVSQGVTRAVRQPDDRQRRRRLREQRPGAAGL